MFTILRQRQKRAVYSSIGAILLDKGRGLQTVTSLFIPDISQKKLSNCASIGYIVSVVFTNSSIRKENNLFMHHVCLTLL
jgi:hypothetical protein